MTQTGLFGFQPKGVSNAFASNPSIQIDGKKIGWPIIEEPIQAESVQAEPLTASIRFAQELPDRIIIPIQPEYQGESNGCGTASAAMVVNYFKPQTTEKRLTQANLDQKHRRLNVFTSPHEMLAIFKQAGLHAWFENQMSFESVQKHLAENRLVIPLYKASKKWDSLHYSVIHGYSGPNMAKALNQKAANQASPGSLLLTNPAVANNPTYWADFKTFDEQYWQKVNLSKFPTGLKSFGIVVSATGKPDFDSAASLKAPGFRLKAAYTAHKLVNGLGKLLNL